MELNNLVERKIKLIWNSDSFSRVKTGDEGVVKKINENGLIVVEWECGIVGITLKESRFTILPKEKKNEIIQEKVIAC